MKTLKPSTFSCALALAFAAAGASAQQAPNIGEVLRQVPPPIAPNAAAAPLPALGGVPTEPPMTALPGGTQKVLVTEFTIVGNRVIDTDTLLALVKPDQGKTWALAEIEAIATRITRYYRGQGYFVARAYVPAQELASGKLTLRVIEGNYGKFVLSNQSLVRDDIVQGLLDDIKDRDIVSLDTLERAMLIINDTPGVKVVRADVMPGEKVGTSDFAIGTEATPRADGYLLLDDHGSAYTGKKRLSFNADWNSPTGRGDRLSLSGIATRDTDLYNGRLAYSTLLRSDGTRGEIAISRTSYELGDIYKALNASGTANAIEFNLSTPIKRTRNHSVEATLGAAYKDLKDEVRSTGTTTGKKAFDLNAGLSARIDQMLAGFDGSTQASATITLGQLSFDNASSRALDAAGARTRGWYGKLNVGLSRATALPAQFAVTASLKAQVVLNDKNLDGSERMSVSGAGGVAAYASGELSGDNAALLRIELARPLPLNLPVQLSASTFINCGWAKAADPLPGRGGRDMSDIGLGLSANAGGGVLRLQLSHRMSGGSPVSEPVHRTRVLVQGGWMF